MAKLGIEGSENFPVTVVDTLNLIETVASQNIRSVKSANSLNDAFYEYDVKDGKVVEEAVFEMAKAQAFDKNAYDRASKDPTLHVKYFNNFEPVQFQTTIRKDDIMAVIENKGTGAEEVVSEIIDTTTQGEGDDDFIKSRNVLYKATFKDYSTIIGGKPANAKGIIYALRDMFNHLKCNNDDLTGAKFKSATPYEDIRIAISTKVLNLIDVTALADTFNLSKVELFGKLVVVDVDDLSDHSKDGYVFVYDRKALGRATRLYDYEQERVVKGRYTNGYLTVERAYFHNDLFKGAFLDCTTAMNAEKAKLITSPGK